MSPRQRYALARLSKLSLVALLCALVTACFWQYREPTVQTVEYQHDVTFAPGGASLTPTAQSDLRDFIAALTVDPGSYTAQSVYVIAPPALVDAAPRVADLNERRAQAVAQELATMSIAVRSPSRTLGTTALLPNTVMVVVQRSVVNLPACPDWQDPNLSSYSNQVSSNWSCATAVNLGMMVADPTDLQLGRQPGVAEADPAARSVQLYREGKTKPLSSNVSTADTYAGDTGSGAGSTSQ